MLQNLPIELQNKILEISDYTIFITCKHFYRIKQEIIKIRLQSVFLQLTDEEFQAAILYLHMQGFSYKKIFIKEIYSVRIYKTFPKQLFKKIKRALIGEKVKFLDELVNLNSLTCFYSYDYNGYSIKIPKKLLNLEYLRCSNINCGEIPELIKLKYLYIFNTNTTKIPEVLINLTHLSVVRTNVSIVPDTLINLIDLDIAYSKVTEIPKTLKKLKYLTCYSTKVKEIPSFQYLTDLTCYDTNIEIIGENPNLNVIVCCRTKLTSLYGLYNSINLTYLDCSETLVSEIPYLENLICLHCSNTLVSVIPPFTKLKTLICNNTQISELPNTLVKLESLDCTNTLIRSLPETLVNLEYLRGSQHLEIPKTIKKLRK